MSTHFENNDVFENASVMLEVCRGEFEHHGYLEEAKTMKGMEATSTNSALAALEFLRPLDPQDELVRPAWSYAIKALELTQQTGLRLVS